jgi:hypothetical protein
MANIHGPLSPGIKQPCLKHAPLLSSVGHITYALLTENSPFVVLHQIITSFDCTWLKGILQILRPSSSWKISRIRDKFHQLESWSISSTTLASSDNIICVDWVTKVVWFGRNLSPQIYISLPSPTRHTSPLWRTSKADIKLLQAKDSHVPKVAPRIVVCG